MKDFSLSMVEATGAWSLYHPSTTLVKKTTSSLPKSYYPSERIEGGVKSIIGRDKGENQGYRL